MFFRCESLEEITLPLESVDILAFALCYNLKRVRIHPSAAKLGSCRVGENRFETIFNNPPNVAAVVEKGSPAEQYCIKYGITYITKESNAE